MANWLNKAFYGFDNSILNAMHGLAKSAGGFFTPFLKAVSVLGEGGIFFIILSVCLMLFSRTRRVGFTMLLAVGVGALFTNVIIKNAVARQRPYTVDEYRGFWQFVLNKEQSEFSFPSGHTTVTMTSMTALFLSCNKKWSWTGFFAVLLMGFSRIYLIVHYPSDVLGGIIVGGISGTIAYFVSRSIFNLINSHSENKFCQFVLSADLKNLFSKNKKED